MIAIVDRKACTGCGLCIQTCPEVFRLDADGKVAVQMESVPWGFGDSCCEAAVECPEETIFIK
jgi:ferredoxin